MKIKPPRLNSRGPRSVLLPPAGPVKPKELQFAIDLLSSKGYRVVLSHHLYEKQGYLAGNDESRLHDLHEMFNDKEIKAVLCARGGYGTLRLLDKIDYDLIQNNPKIIVGYSDITALLLAIYRKTGLITFHGPVLRDLSEKKEKNINIFCDFVSTGIFMGPGSIKRAGAQGRKSRWHCY